ncbi:hypothetical protein Desor_1598 [Desulfosporosinus orientis DSM 765]|uniref:Anti-sigma-W factor RsiW n=1 Tax=Desulfosporosinus orientis (strain ATCC 19365 / DSM 765 / NCIMB 8382 / VKM B-1628 / Singapore I) TaxID=768706 RepID=G7WD50_DESOD|nr:zf-HC2 domain-containing protein [Desulfosporosinus orientis]AET67245.1 hypothetical protein Desor_1598 [Desulfosporosinus orientis DSM 765]
MECRECLGNISAFIDGELGGDLQEQMEAHLQTCEDCQSVAHQLRSLNSGLVQAYASIQAPLNLEERILISIKMEKKKAKQQFALTAFVLVLLLCPFMLFSSLVWRFLQIIYAVGSLLGQLETALMRFFPLTFSWVIGGSAILLSIGGILLVRAMLKGFHVNEVLS